MDKELLDEKLEKLYKVGVAAGDQDRIYRTGYFTVQRIRLDDEIRALFETYKNKEVEKHLREFVTEVTHVDHPDGIDKAKAFYEALDHVRSSLEQYISENLKGSL